MRSLVVPDIHLRHMVVDEILAREKWDKCIILGDLFDDFGDTVERNASTALWFVDKLQDERIEWIAGNHDLSYLSGIFEHRCSGYTHEKALAINAIVKREHFARMKLSVMEQGWLISHAGWHEHWVNHVGSMGPVVAANVAMQMTLNGKFVCLLGPGQLRGGNQAFGGITWCDWREFKPHPNYRQIFGHTPGRHIRGTPDDRNLCIDTNSRHYAVIEEGEVEIKDV